MSRLSKNEFERRQARHRNEVLFEHPRLQERERERVLFIRRMAFAFTCAVALLCAAITLASCA